MTIKQFIEKAIEGGWDESSANSSDVKPLWLREKMFLDPDAWQAVGKVEGWHLGTFTKDELITKDNCDDRDRWKDKMLGMTQALIEGKTIEEFIETL